MSPRLIVLIEWLCAASKRAGGRGFLVPVSGGSDSALCLWLCARAAPAKTVALHAGSDLRCRAWFESVAPLHCTEPPTPGPDADIGRWSQALALARELGTFLVGTRNRTEECLGTYSLASRLATILPLAGLWKTEVMALAAEVGVPEEVLASSRQPDPDCGRPAELAAIAFADVDRFLRAEAGELPASDLDDVPPMQRAYLAALRLRNQFKSDLPLRPTYQPLANDVCEVV